MPSMSCLWPQCYLQPDRALQNSSGFRESSSRTDGSGYCYVASWAAMRLSQGGVGYTFGRETGNISTS